LNIEELQKFYSGFYINDPEGNNAFSYKERKNKKIFVPPLISGDIDDISVGDKIAFSEIEDGIELNNIGLKQFVHISKKGKEIFVFDNHNHAFCFWLYAFKNKYLNKGSTLVHIDQHTDMSKPDKHFEQFNDGRFLMKDAFEYTNRVLNVGNFIVPAQEVGLFSKVHILNSQDKFIDFSSKEIVLDIDIDLFIEGMNHFPDNIKLDKINDYFKYAKIITIATSPFFIEQNKAIDIVKKILEKI